jgi:hypothetical protein
MWGDMPNRSKDIPEDDEDGLPALWESHNDLKRLVESDMKPALETLEKDMSEIRTMLGTVATTKDILMLTQTMNQGNNNMAAALASVPSDEARRVANANLWWTGIMSVGTVGLFLYEIWKH